ncbi:MAG: hypothetical protein COU69_04790 [Candidatus Pacebacteria bacterium CG10_big_fil_rev_8_21_14_0_10_56_10]|nr:MAG: hypothetical protein COU69_04790 [Candidatus Pacebacteria bacterium CG10_big_fil_rev_8_21_14_0_10_56_10]
MLAAANGATDLSLLITEYLEKLLLEVRRQSLEKRITVSLGQLIEKHMLSVIAAAYEDQIQTTQDADLANLNYHQVRELVLAAMRNLPYKANPIEGSAYFEETADAAAKTIVDKILSSQSPASPQPPAAQK